MKQRHNPRSRQRTGPLRREARSARGDSSPEARYVRRFVSGGRARENDVTRIDSLIDHMDRAANEIAVECSPLRQIHAALKQHDSHMSISIPSREAFKSGGRMIPAPAWTTRSGPVLRRPPARPAEPCVSTSIARTPRRERKASVPAPVRTDQHLKRNSWPSTGRHERAGAVIQKLAIPCNFSKLTYVSVRRGLDRSCSASNASL